MWSTFGHLKGATLGTTLGLFGYTWDRLGTILGLLGDYVGITCGLYGVTWDCSGTTLGLLLVYFGTTWGLGTNCGLRQDYLETTWRLLGNILGTCLGRFGVSLFSSGFLREFQVV